MGITGTDNWATKENRVRHWLRVLRPIGWWLILVMVLFAIRTHQRLSPETRLVFSTSLLGKEVSSEVSASVDRHPVRSGEQISIGWHTLTLSHGKAEPFQTNLFIWYGKRDLGNVSLKRAHGVLDIKVEPQARLLTIQGPEFKESFTNSAGFTLTLPTDAYSIHAHYANWEQHDEIMILNNQTNSWRMAPRLGALAFTCNLPEAVFELMGPNDRLIETSVFPAKIVELPEGNYKVLTRHRRYEWEKKVTVQAGITNEVVVELAYGKAVIETEPMGASVTGSSGQEWGFTPLTLIEVPVGPWKFTLKAEGYEPAIAALEIMSNQTVCFHTNLVSRNH